VQDSTTEAFVQALERGRCSRSGRSGQDLQNLFFRSCFPQQVSFTFFFERLHGVEQPVWHRFSASSITVFEELNTLST